MAAEQTSPETKYLFVFLQYQAYMIILVRTGPESDMAELQEQYMDEQFEAWGLTWAFI